LGQINLFVFTNQYNTPNSLINPGAGLAQVVTNVSEKLPPDEYRVFVFTLATQDTEYQPQPNVNVIGLKPRRMIHGTKREPLYFVCPTGEGIDALDLGFTSLSYIEKKCSEEMRNAVVWANDWFTACPMITLYEEHQLQGVYTWHLSKKRPDENDMRLNWGKKVAENIKNSGSLGHAVSETQKTIVRNAYSLPTKKVVAIRNGVDTKIFRPYEPDSYSPTLEEYDIKRPFYCWTGRTAEEKRADQVVKSFPQVLEEYPDEHLVILGLSDQSGLGSLYREHNLLKPDVKSKVKIILGNVSNENRAKIYAAADVGVFPSDPSKAPEALGIVSLECQSCGTPAAVNKDTGLIETIIPGLTGLVVDGSNSYELADATVECISRREQWGRNARDLAERYFSWTDIVKEYDELLFSRLI